MKYAVIDVGSNSVRLLLIENGKSVRKTLTTTRLGEGLAFSSFLKEEAISRTVKAIFDFLAEARSFGAKEVACYATAAVRSADNREEFLSAVEKSCGLKVEVISGEREADLGRSGALRGKDGTLVDLGGGSAELTVFKDGKTVYAKSLGIGVVKLLDECGRNRSALEKKVREKLEEYGKVPILSPVIAIGGTATTLGALAVGKETYDPALVSGKEIDKGEMQEFAERLTSLSVEEIKKLPAMQPQRADLIGGGAVFFFELADKFSIDKFVVSDADNLEGYATEKGWIL